MADVFDALRQQWHGAIQDAKHHLRPLPASAASAEQSRQEEGQEDWIWRTGAFAGEFGDAFIKNTNLEGGDVPSSMELLTNVIRPLVDVPALAAQHLPLLDEKDLQELSSVLKSFDEAVTLGRRLFGMRLQSEKFVAFLTDWIALVRDLPVGQFLIVNGGWLVATWRLGTGNPSECTHGLLETNILQCVATQRCMSSKEMLKTPTLSLSSTLGRETSTTLCTEEITPRRSGGPPSASERSRGTPFLKNPSGIFSSRCASNPAVFMAPSSSTRYSFLIWQETQPGQKRAAFPTTAPLLQMWRSKSALAIVVTLRRCSGAELASFAPFSAPSAIAASAAASVLKSASKSRLLCVPPSYFELTTTCANSSVYWRRRAPLPRYEPSRAALAAKVTDNFE